MPRLLTIIQTNKPLTDYSKRLLRKEAGVKSTKQLIQLAVDSGVSIGKRKDTQEKRSYNYFADIYNGVAEKENKKIIEERKEEKKNIKVFAIVADVKFKTWYITIAGKDKYNLDTGDIFFGKNSKLRQRIIKENPIGNKFVVVNGVSDGTSGDPIIRQFVSKNKKQSDIDIEKKRKELEKESPYHIVEVISKDQKKLKVDKSKYKDVFNSPIKEAGQMNLDGIIDNDEWCRNLGTCVPDWLMYKYKNKKGHIKSVKNIETIEYLSTNKNIGSGFLPDKFVEQEPNKNGYTIDNIILFCENTQKNLFCLHNGEIIYETKEKYDCRNPLVIEIKNNHLYPIVNTTAIKSITHRSQNALSKQFRKGISKEEEPIELENIEIVNLYEKSQSQGGMSQLTCCGMEMLEQNKQIYNSEIVMTNDNLLPFKLDGKLYTTTPKVEVIEKYCKKNNIRYTGQSPAFFSSKYIENLPSSTLNSCIEDALFRDGVKNRTHIGRLENFDFDEIDIGDVVCVDINKHYRYCMENPLDNFMMLNFDSKIREINSYDNLFGLYFIETDDLTIFHQSNWYSNKIIELAIKEGIEFEVKYFISGKRIENKNILKDIIDKITDDFKDDKDLSKLIINSISGLLGKTKTTKAYLSVDTDINRVYEFCKGINTIEDIVFKHLQNQDEKNLYIYGKKRHDILTSNNLPMYIQILDWSNVVLYNLIKELGGIENCYYRKTDCIVMRNLDLELNYTDEIGGYNEETIPLTWFDLDTNRKVNYEYKELEWKHHDKVKTSDDWKIILDIAINSGGCMVIGRAGTGKSYTIKQIEKIIKVEKIAFTNKASNNIQGKTIHKFLKIDANSKIDREWCKKIKYLYDAIIVDEISMISADLWCKLSLVKKISGLPFIICGDYRQLPPVNDDFDFFNHPAIKSLVNCNKVELNVSSKSRYDKELLEYSNNVADGNGHLNTYEYSKFNPELPCICYTNKVREQVNKVINKYHSNNKNSVLIEYLPDDEEEENNYSQDIIMYDGLKLLANTTITKQDIYKNETYFVKSFNDTNFIIETADGEEQSFLISNIHKNFLLGYCLTTHKSQGDTIDGDFQILELYKMMNDKRLFYTAITRGRSVSNIKYIN